MTGSSCAVPARSVPRGYAMAKKAETTIPLPSPKTHMLVTFGSWGATYLMPIEAAGQLLPLMRDAYAVETDRVNNTTIYTVKSDKQMKTEWMDQGSVTIPNIPKSHRDAYVTSLKATVELQGDTFNINEMPFDEWYVEYKNPSQ